MKTLKHLLFIALVMVLASGTTLAQRGHRYLSAADRDSIVVRDHWHPRNDIHFGLSDSCWRVFLSELPADTARMLVGAIDDIKDARLQIDTLQHEYRAARRGGDTARALHIWNEIQRLFLKIRSDKHTIDAIMRQYQALLIDLRKNCNPHRRNTIGLRVTPVVPNPATTSAHFTYIINAADHVLIQIFNQSGNVTKTVFDDQVDAGEHEVRLDLSGMQSGAYLVRIQAGPDVNTLKLVIRS